MTADSPTIGERLAHVEATLPHLATRADVERLRADLQADVRGMEARLLVRLGGGLAAGVGLVLAAIRVWAT